MGTFLLIVAGIFGVLLVLRLLGGLFGRSAGPGMPGAGMGMGRPGMGGGPGYYGGPGYGGGGGGFMSGLFGGLGGAWPATGYTTNSQEGTAIWAQRMPPLQPTLPRGTLTRAVTPSSGRTTTLVAALRGMTAVARTSAAATGAEVTPAATGAGVVVIGAAVAVEAIGKVRSLVETPVLSCDTARVDRQPLIDRLA